MYESCLYPKGQKANFINVIRRAITYARQLATDNEP